MKLTIGSLDDLDLPVVEAHYNPKEIDLGKQAAWTDLKTIRAAKGESSDLEYTGSPARTMGLELLFDGYERGESIEPIVVALQRLASPRDEDASDAHLRRPHICIVVWADNEFPRFQCVIESVAVKYTMFSKTGKPLRATCQIKLKEIRPQHRRQGLAASPQYVAPRREDCDHNHVRNEWRRIMEERRAQR